MNPEGRQFVVPVHDLDRTGRDVSAVLSKEWIDAVLAETELRRASDEGSLVAHLSKTGNEILVRGTVRVALEIDCARCLEPVRLDRPLELTLLLRPAAPQAKRPQGSAARPIPHRERLKAGVQKGGATKQDRKPSRPRPEEEYEFTAQEADADVYEGDEVVLDRFIREAILLEEPIFPLCSDACEGIRPAPQTSPPHHSQGEAADATQATDPRLARIAELAKRKTKE